MVNITMFIISAIWFTLDLSVSSVLRPYLHMLGSSSLTRVFLHVQNWLAPVVDERWAYHTWSSRGVSARRTLATVHTQGEHFLIISERSSYNATVKQSKIRCIKDKHHMQSKYVTWYGHHHLAPLISISKVLSWSPLLPAWHHDLHHLDLLSTCRHMFVSPAIAFATIAIA